MEEMITTADFISDRDFSRAFSTLALFESGPLAGQTTEIGCRATGARFQWKGDLSPLFPYINAVADHAQYFEKPEFIKFLFAKRLCGLHADQGAFAPVDDLAEAMVVLPRLLDFLQNIAHRRSEIVPRHKRFKPVSAVDIYRLLPGSNCRLCGYATCIAFAAALSRQQSTMAKCPHLVGPVEETAMFPVFDRKGNLVRTVALHIDTASLRRKIDQKEDRIRTLESRLSHLERNREESFDAANSRLPAPLTRRERQVLQKIIRGSTNRQISADLAISQHTVKSHVIGIFNKLGVNDRAQAAAWGALHGL